MKSFETNATTRTLLLGYDQPHKKHEDPRYVWLDQSSGVPVYRIWNGYEWSEVNLTPQSEKPKERMKLHQWISLVLWPILMITGLYFMVSFNNEVLGVFGCILLVVGLIVASIFMFGKVDSGG